MRNLLKFAVLLLCMKLLYVEDRLARAPELSFYEKWSDYQMALRGASNPYHYHVSCRGSEHSTGAQLPNLALTALWGGCTDTYVISDGPGGDLWLHRQAAEEILAGSTTVEIDGRCASGCAVLADIARAKVCITHQAVFEFHQGYQNLWARVDGRMRLVQAHFSNQPQSADIDAWVRSQPKRYPINGTTNMPYEVAKHYWRTCPEDIPHLLRVEIFKVRIHH